MSHSSALYPRLETIFVKQLYWIFSEYYFTTHRLCTPKIQSCFIHNFELISLSFDGILQENKIKGKKNIKFRIILNWLFVYRVEGTFCTMLLYNIKQSMPDECMSVYGFIEWVLLLFSVALKWQHSLTPRVCVCVCRFQSELILL